MGLVFKVPYVTPVYSQGWRPLTVSSSPQPANSDSPGRLVKMQMAGPTPECLLPGLDVCQLADADASGWGP
jgi:hypothetical protein